MTKLDQPGYEEAFSAEFHKVTKFKILSLNRVKFGIGDREVFALSKSCTVVD